MIHIEIFLQILAFCLRYLFLLFIHLCPSFGCICTYLSAAPPLWLKVLCCIEVFLFGPLYLLTAHLLRVDPHHKLLTSVALPFAGALIYSTIVYFAMEVSLSEPGTNFWLVFIVNLPWTIIPLLLIVYLHEMQGEDKAKKSLKQN